MSLSLVTELLTSTVEKDERVRTGEWRERAVEKSNGNQLSHCQFSYLRVWSKGSKTKVVPTYWNLFNEKETSGVQE